jgi:hypothetical protein
MIAQVDAFNDHTATGGVFIGGSAMASFEFTPFEEVATGGAVAGGSAETISSNYSHDSSGGLIVSGTSSLKSSSWSYCGGEWPSILGRNFSLEQESLQEDLSDQAWSLVEQIGADDNLYSSTDISFIKTSEFLIARNFNFDIPDDADHEVLGLTVSIERFSTQSGVRDLEVYLVLGDEIISDNLADTTNDWPVGVSFSSKKYGSNGYDGKTPWSNEPLLATDLNDTTFGVALRVESQQFLPAIIANVDYITAKAFYQNVDDQLIRMGGEASIKSTAMSYVGSGQINIAGNADEIKSTTVFNETASGGMVTSGTLNFVADEVGTGGVATSGEAVVDPIWGEGGATISGAAKVTPYFETGLGGVTTGGSALVNDNIELPVSGGVLVGGIAIIANYTYEASGGVTMGGIAGRSSSAWNWESDGNAIFILGSADSKGSDLGTFDEEFGFEMVVDDLIVQYNNDEHLGDAESLTQNISTCGCRTIPLLINFEHNFVSKTNILGQFLSRNRFVMSDRLTLAYNVPNNSWQTNLHYRGLAPDAIGTEIWDIVFEVQCTSLIGSVEIGRAIWKLAIQFFRKNLTTGEDFDARIIMGVLPEPICETNANDLKFTVTYDTQANVASVDPTATIYQSSIFDNIGLFKKPEWIDNPNLILTVSETGLSIPQQRVDVVDDVLNPDDRPVGYFSSAVIGTGPTIPPQLQNQN